MRWGAGLATVNSGVGGNSVRRRRGVGGNSGGGSQQLRGLQPLRTAFTPQV